MASLLLTSGKTLQLCYLFIRGRSWGGVYKILKIKLPGIEMDQLIIYIKVPLQRKNFLSNFKHNRTTFTYKPCFVLEILLRFFETCKIGVSDVIYTRIINYIYQMVNISVNSRHKLFKLCMTVAIW